jgi:hypothetical protein
MPTSSSEPRSAAKVPYSAPSEPDEYERTTKARLACTSCGEWVYPRRRKGSTSPFAFPPECDVCGEPVKP